MDLSRRTVLFGVPALAATALTTPAAAAASPPHQSPIHIRSRAAVSAPDLPALQIDYPQHVELRVRYMRKDESDPAGPSDGARRRRRPPRSVAHRHLRPHTSCSRCAVPEIGVRAAPHTLDR